MGLSGSPAPTQRHEGRKGHVKGCLGKWKGELGSNLIKLYYTQLWNCQRINTRYFLKWDNKSKKHWTLTSSLYSHRNGPPHHTHIQWVLDIIHNPFIFCSRQATSQGVSPLIHLTPRFQTTQLQASALLSFILFLGAWFWHHTLSSPGMPSLTLYFVGRINRSIFCVLFVRFSYNNPLQTWLQSSCIGVPISFQVWALRAGTILASSTQLPFSSKLKQTVWTQYLLFKELLFVQAHLELYTFLEATAELIREWNILLLLSSHPSGSFCDGLTPGHSQWAS